MLQRIMPIMAVTITNVHGNKIKNILKKSHFGTIKTLCFSDMLQISPFPYVSTEYFGGKMFFGVSFLTLYACFCIRYDANTTFFRVFRGILSEKAIFTLKLCLSYAYYPIACRKKYCWKLGIETVCLR